MRLMREQQLNTPVQSAAAQRLAVSTVRFQRAVYEGGTVDAFAKKRG